MNFDIKKLLNKIGGDQAQDDQYELSSDVEEEEDEEVYYVEDTSGSLNMTAEEISQYEQNIATGVSADQTQGLRQASPDMVGLPVANRLRRVGEQQETLIKKKKKELFDSPEKLEDLKISQSIIEDLLLKFLFFIGEATGLELATRLRVPLNTIVDPILMGLNDAGFLYILRSTGLGGHNKIYNLTEKGQKRARDAVLASSYIGPAPVHIDDYIKAVNEYPALKVPKFDKFKDFYRDLVVPEKFLEEFAIALSSGECLFLYGTPGMGKTTLVRRFLECCPDEINVPFSVYADGTIVRFFDESFHKTIDKDFSIDTPIQNHQIDNRWVKIHRPCVLVGTEFSAVKGTNIQYDSTGTSCSFPVTTKSNGGVFIMDDFGRQPEEPHQILNMWIGKLEGAQDVLAVKTGQQFYVPYKTLTIFTTNLQPKDLLDDAFLRRLSYKLRIPDVDLESFCQIFANEAEKRKVSWDDSTLEYLIQEYYSKKNRSLAADHPRGILSRIAHICRYRGEKPPYTMTKELLELSWRMHFIS